MLCSLYTVISWFPLLFFAFSATVCSSAYNEPIAPEQRPTVFIKHFDQYMFSTEAALLDMNNRYASYYNCRRCFLDLIESLREDGLTVKFVASCPDTIHPQDFLLVFDHWFDPGKDFIDTFSHDHRILFLWEPEHVQPWGYDKALHARYARVFTWNDDLVDNKKYFKFYIPQPFLQMVQEPIDFSSKKLCTMIASNKLWEHPNELYRKRQEAAFFFECYAPNDFDLWGWYWTAGSKTYRGVIPLSERRSEDTANLAIAHQTKLDYLRYYRFAICYENLAKTHGYITEKIFDCFSAGCVPIYWGADNISDYIPSGCYIDRRTFANNRDLYIYIKNMSIETYQGYIKNIQDFLQSEKAYPFSTTFFIQTIRKALAYDSRP